MGLFDDLGVRGTIRIGDVRVQLGPDETLVPAPIPTVPARSYPFPLPTASTSRDLVGLSDKELQNWRDALLDALGQVRKETARRKRKPAASGK